MHGNLKKKYGQNFLIDNNILEKISHLIRKKHLDIIEIGPGDGRLTDYILSYDPKKLTIIEIDQKLIPVLNAKFNKIGNIKIINEDILFYKLNKKVDLIISNLPYNISSQILVKICLMKNLPNNLILMFQREFAQRLLDKKLNSLSALVNCFYDVNSHFNVSKNCFRPIPKIDSSVLSFSKKKNLLLKKNEIKSYIEFKRYVFSYKRKSLKKILRNYSLKQEDFSLSKRIEELNLNQFLDLFRAINL